MTSSADSSSLRNRSAIAADTACADAAISSSRRSKIAWTTRSSSRSCVMSMCWRSMLSLPTVSAARHRVVMPEQLPAISGKSRGSVARMDRCGQGVEHGDGPALVLKPEQRLRDPPPQGGRVHADLELDIRLILRRRELKARVGAAHGAAKLRLLQFLEPLDDPHGVERIEERHDLARVHVLVTLSDLLGSLDPDHIGPPLRMRARIAHDLPHIPHRNIDQRL